MKSLQKCDKIYTIISAAIALLARDHPHLQYKRAPLLSKNPKAAAAADASVDSCKPAAR